jgi:hypothetical protein
MGRKPRLTRNERREKAPHIWQATIGEGGPPLIRHIPTLLQFHGTEKHSVVRAWDQTQGVVLGVMFRDHGRDRVLGSAVLVGAGVALTAHHVLDAEWRAIENGTTAIRLLGYPAPGKMVVWRPYHLRHLIGTDLALLTMEPDSGFPHEMRYATLTARTPVRGESVTICGFRASRPEFEGWEGMKSQTLLSATGDVDQVWPDASLRGSYKPWPWFDVDCFQPSGVSGGGVFDAKGKLMGMFSSSMDAMPGEKAGPSYVAMLRGDMWTQRVPTPWPQGLRDRSLLELTLDKLAHVDQLPWKFDPITGGKQIDRAGLGLRASS